MDGSSLCFLNKYNNNKKASHEYTSICNWAGILLYAQTAHLAQGPVHRLVHAHVWISLQGLEVWN